MGRSTKKATALLDAAAPGQPGTISVALRQQQVQQNIADLEAHCNRQQALIGQLQLNLEYCQTENEQLRLAITPLEVDAREPIRISVQIDASGRAVELQIKPSEHDLTAVVRTFCRNHGLKGSRPPWWRGAEGR